MGLLSPDQLEAMQVMGLGLLAGQSPHAAVNVGNAGLDTVRYMRAREMEKARLAEEEQQRRMREMAMQKQAQAEAAQAQMGQQFAQQYPHLAQLYQLNPQEAVKRAFPGEEKPMVLSPGQEVFDPKTGEKRFGAAPKPKFEIGSTREIKSGPRVITQEYDGKEWKTIGTSPLWKPDAPSSGPAAPQGYRWKQDGSGLEPIPGGPADQKVGEKAESLKKREAGAIERADFVLGKVKEAIGQAGFTTTGTIGAIARNIPGTGGFNLNKTVDAIKANIGFAELQAMREASPTGGALGQVAVQELSMLQSVLGSLDTAQSQDQLLKSLYAIEKHYNGWKSAVQQASGQGKPSGGWSIQKVD